MKTAYRVYMVAYGITAINVVFTRKPEREEVVQLVHDKNKGKVTERELASLVALASTGNYGVEELECYD